ncbi:MAG: hypothetical protein EXR98_04695 [Gemmataceae bacterium]|nr:hypothetical protein [Gemmataceae bacterium]
MSAYDEKDDEVDAEIKKLRAAPSTLKCQCCGSDRIIPTATLDGTEGQLRVTVIADPTAVIFKGYESELVTVRLCGECGHVALFSENPGRLYAVYLTSLKIVNAKILES